MTALAATGVPVPKTYALCRDDAVIGTEFFVMEYKPGRIFWDLLADGSSPGERAAMWLSAIDAMAALHRVEPAAVELADFGRGGNYIERQVARWSGQYEKSRNAVDNPAMDRLIEWLPRVLPEQEGESLIHGDLQFSNMVYHPHEPRVSAVLDWELSTIGNPLSDLAYFCRVYHLPAEHGGLLGLSYRAHGIPEEQALHEVLDMMSCKAAIKAGDKMSEQELASLLEQRDAIERSSNCPHGRPTTLRLTLKDLERQFGRS